MNKTSIGENFFYSPSIFEGIFGQEKVTERYNVLAGSAFVYPDDNKFSVEKKFELIKKFEFNNPNILFKTAFLVIACVKNVFSFLSAGTICKKTEFFWRPFDISKLAIVSETQLFKIKELGNNLNEKAVTGDFEKSKSEGNAFYIGNRASINQKNYNPVSFTHERVMDNSFSENKLEGWADPVDFKSIGNPEKDLRASEGSPYYDPIYGKPLAKRITYHGNGKLVLDKYGKPIFQGGKTGTSGRGLLGKWGPNFAADPIVTRVNPKDGTIEMIQILRSDGSAWAIPGGMVDPNEGASDTAVRELWEEAFGIKEHKDLQVLAKEFRKAKTEVFIAN